MEYDYNATSRDAFHFLQTGIIEHRCTTSDESWRQFIEELYLQEQINETELDVVDITGSFVVLPS